jgi:hypothetical protein
MVLTLVSFTSLLYDWVVDGFLKRPTIALLLHRIAQVTQCVCILTKALPLLILLLRIAYVELMVGGLEACTCFTYIAKSKLGSIEMIYHISRSRLCVCIGSE